MNEKTYFNLYTSGLGYVNRVRTVTPKRGEPFLCCDIAALCGQPMRWNMSALTAKSPVTKRGN
ncbi:Periplasmic protein TonB [Salmonella enterica subsp. enterica serovar Sanjuan]|uniref:Periplasmic protein TonB n=1 Tax=Salmonella enterica subsp. enterica serovar Sanjuan TaxID=1160765 RepID=A0A3S4IZM2_SALET|nr:Periplasmic protein TonB [Salmonella enterica subsp. enterica serovar Sanjuan]